MISRTADGPRPTRSVHALGGDLTGIDVGALLRRLSGTAGADGVTRVPIASDGDGATGHGAGNGAAGNGAKGNGAPV